MMSTEHDFRKGTKQYSALKQYLKNVDRGVTPWLVFAGHRWLIFNKADLKLSLAIPIKFL